MSTATLDKRASRPAVDSATIVGTFENLFRLVSVETTEVLLVRHAEPDYPASASADDDPLDPPLTERGRYQAIRLAQRLHGMDVGAIYTSTARRAVETAAIITGTKDVTMFRTAQLREIGVGSGVISNGAEDDPQRFATRVLLRFLNNPRWDAIAGMEPSREFRYRIVQAVNDIVNRHPGQRVVLVTHAGVINAALSTVLGIQRDMFFLPEHASISVMRVLRDLRSVQSLNDFSHLLPTFSPR